MIDREDEITRLKRELAIAEKELKDSRAEYRELAKTALIKNQVLLNALKNACETIVSQYIGDEHYMDVIEEWKEKNDIEFVGVDGQLLEDYFLIQAEDEFEKENKDEEV